MVDFSKSEDCPASAELLDFENGDISLERGAAIRRHLSGCEFCSAESDFYARYPLASEDEMPEPTKIPEPLFELAEALLKHRSDNTALDLLLINEELASQSL